ncbi:IclR family transcriptional regulator [Brucella sp. LJL56]
MDVSANDERSRLFVGSVEKCFKIIEAFSGARYFTLAELCVRSGFDKSTVQRMTHTLAELGYLEQCPMTRRFALSNRTLDLSYHFLRNHPLIERATPMLIELRREFDERVDLSLFDGSSLVYAQRLQSQREHYYTTLAGRRIPLYCTAGGRAVLSCLSADRAKDIITATEKQSFTRFTRVNDDDILAEIEATRERGYGLARNELIENELVIATAITDENNNPIAAVHVAANSARWTDQEFADKVVPGMLRAVSFLR